MKFIVDAQLPRSLSDFLISRGYDSIHTLELPDKNRTVDHKIISISTKENRIVISKDSDFLESFLLKNQPPKLILVKIGNTRNNVLLNMFDKNIENILKQLVNNSLIVITKTEIVVHI